MPRRHGDISWKAHAIRDLTANAGVAVARRPDPSTDCHARCAEAGQFDTGGDSSEVGGAADREEEEGRQSFFRGAIIM